MQCNIQLPNITKDFPLLRNRPTWSARVRRRWSRACTISSLSSCRSRRPIRSGPRRTPWRSLLFTALLASDALIQGDGEALSLAQSEFDEALSLALSEFEPRVVGILTSVCCARRQLTFCDMDIVWQSQRMLLRKGSQRRAQVVAAAQRCSGLCSLNPPDP